MRSARGDLEIECVQFTFRECESGPTWPPFLQKIRVALLAGLEVINRDRDVAAGRKTFDREASLLIGTCAADETRPRSPLRRFIEKDDDRGIEHDVVVIVGHAARNGRRLRRQLDFESVDVGAEVQSCP